MVAAYLKLQFLATNCTDRRAIVVDVMTYSLLSGDQAEDFFIGDVV